MDFSQRLVKFAPSATLTVNAKALALAAQGIPVLNLAVGEPDFPTPAFIGQAAKDAIDNGFTKYTPVEGIVELRQAVCDYYARHYGATLSPQNIIITNGGKQALYNSFMVLLNSGDEVLLPTPYWTSYPDMIRLADGEIRMVCASSRSGFRINIKMLEQSITAHCKLLLLNSPSNPTGSCYNQSELDELVEWALSRDLYVLSDEIYDQLVYAPAKPASAAKWLARYPEKVFIVNGLSKSYAMTGWRIGYAIAHIAAIKEMAKIQGQTTSNINSITQKAAFAALRDDTFSTSMNTVFAHRRDIAFAEIQTWPDVVCQKPDGAFYIFPDISAYFNQRYPSASSVCEYLLEKAQVAIMPGEAFGDANCIRLSYAVADEVLCAALTKIKTALLQMRG